MAESGQASLADWNAPSERSGLRSFQTILDTEPTGRRPIALAGKRQERRFGPPATPTSGLL
jgi:hypothetical protein